MSDYPMLISNKLHSFRNFWMQRYVFLLFCGCSMADKAENGLHKDVTGVDS